MEIDIIRIGSILDTDVHQFTVRNSQGVQLTCLSYGATLNSLICPDRNGVLEEVILCASYDELISAESKKPKYVGTIGRVSNRIAKGKFDLDGSIYSLAINNGENHLHGGLRGFDKVVWSWSIIQEDDTAGVKFSYSSPHLEEGYPGTLEVTAEYRLTARSDVVMKFEATTDRLGPVSITNHAFWNLSGSFSRSIRDHTLHLACDRYLPVDLGLIPEGVAAPVAGTPFDFTSPSPLGPSIDSIIHNGVHGIDHSFVVSKSNDDLPFVATLSDPDSGRQLTIHCNQPAIQVYTGNFLPLVSADTDPFRQHYGVCLECQGYPDAVNQPQFPSILLGPGEVYSHHAIYSFRVAPTRVIY
jgi:aldose 1-epimerase